MAGHDYMTRADLTSHYRAPPQKKWPQLQNIDGTFDEEGGMVKGAVDDFFSCAVIAGDGHNVDRARVKTSGSHCDHLRTVVVAYGAAGQSQVGDDPADDFPRSWYVRK